MAFKAKLTGARSPTEKDESVATLTMPFLHIVCLIEQGKRDA
jgi:hypothetical protein